MIKKAVSILIGLTFLAVVLGGTTVFGHWMDAVLTSLFVR